jgi:hypothetical protein
LEVLAMPRIRLYLDETSHARVEQAEQAAQANGVSKSRWVAELIRKHAAHEWPQDCLRVAGRFPDFPLRGDPPALPADAPRC